MVSVEIQAKLKGKIADAHLPEELLDFLSPSRSPCWVVAFADLATLARRGSLPQRDSCPSNIFVGDFSPSHHLELASDGSFRFFLHRLTEHAYMVEVDRLLPGAIPEGLDLNPLEQQANDLIEKWAGFRVKAGVEPLAFVENPILIRPGR